MSSMDNPEEIMHCLEEFSKLKPKDIPRELDDYLGYVAKTGDPVFKWSIIKGFFREKLLSVITDFYESTLTMELPPCPNVDPFNYERMKASLLEKLDSFHGAPFTVQRICELLTNPRKEYKRADKFMRAIEKNILVVSIREPGRQEIEIDQQDSSFNGMPEANDSTIVSSTFPCNDLPDATSNYEVVNSESHIHNSLKPSLMETLPQTAMVLEETTAEESKIIPEKTEDKSEPCVVENNTVPEEISSLEKDTESVICSTININPPEDAKPVISDSNEVSNLVTSPPESMVMSVTEEDLAVTTNDVEMPDQHVSPSAAEVLESKVASEAVSEIQSEPVTEIQSEPVTEIQSEPVTEIQSEPVSEVQNEPTSEVQSESVPEIQSEHVSEIQSEPISEVQSEPTQDAEAEPFPETSESAAASSPERSTECKNIIDSDLVDEPVSETTEETPIPEASGLNTPPLDETDDVVESVNNVELPKVECHEKLELKDLVDSNECEEPVLSTQSEQVDSDSTTESSVVSTDAQPETESNEVECDTSNGVENQAVELETTSEAEIKTDSTEMQVDSQESESESSDTPKADSVPMVETEDNEVSESGSSVSNLDSEMKEDEVDSCDSSREASVIQATSSEEKSESMEVDSHSMEVDSQTPSNDQVECCTD